MSTPCPKWAGGSRFDMLLNDPLKWNLGAACSSRTGERGNSFVVRLFFTHLTLENVRYHSNKKRNEISLAPKYIFPGFAFLLDIFYNALVISLADFLPRRTCGGPLYNASMLRGVRVPDVIAGRIFRNMLVSSGDSQE